ncbi:MAG TPA: class I SAM-dependent methyltransferase [Thermomicrobiales bacterium]|nr:class I SAM-dependent methyltransferase [Thermomicrobiales bacterium]
MADAAAAGALEGGGEGPEGYGVSTYGDRIADWYDRLFEAAFDLEGTVDLLAGLAGGGRALELGIGTGRVALPLAARGVEVHGIDSSEAMVAKLRAKPGGDRIPVTMGSFVDLPVEGAFALVYVPFNTFFAPLTQEEQVRCMASVAAHLEPGGRFVIDAFVPDPARFARGQAWEVQRIETDAMLIEAVRHDPVGQRLAMQRVVMTAEGTRMFPVNVRYAWPAELDLMARLAGLDLEHRWGGWRRQPFGAESRAHVSVYRRPGAGAGTGDR